MQINGKPNEKLLNETDIWTFNHRDFKSAVTCLILNDELEIDQPALRMKELISKHFETESSAAATFTFGKSSIFLRIFLQN